LPFRAKNRVWHAGAIEAGCAIATAKWLACATVDTTLAWFTIVGAAAFLADSGAAEETGRTLGGAGAAVRGIVSEVDAHVIAENLPLWALSGCLVEPGGGSPAQDGSPGEDLEDFAASVPLGQQTRPRVESLIVHVNTLLFELVLSVKVRSIEGQLDLHGGHPWILRLRSGTGEFG